MIKVYVSSVQSGKYIGLTIEEGGYEALQDLIKRNKASTFILEKVGNFPFSQQSNYSGKNRTGTGSAPISRNSTQHAQPQQLTLFSSTKLLLFSLGSNLLKTRFLSLSAFLLYFHTTFMLTHIRTHFLVSQGG